MLTPLKSAFDTTLAIWSRRDLKSSFRAWRLVVSSEVSEAASALAFIWVSRSETCWPADIATSMVDWARLRLSFTASSEVTLPFIVWAIDQIAPLSLAELIVLPVEMMFCVDCSEVCVLARLDRAINADALVLMLLSAIRLFPFLGGPRHCGGAGLVPDDRRRLPLRGEAERR